jgi:uncharacterized protein
MMNNETIARLKKYLTEKKTPPRITHESFEKNLEEYLQAEVYKTPYGSCLVKHDYYPDGHRHGISDIHSLLKYPCEILQFLTGLKSSAHFEDLCDISESIPNELMNIGSNSSPTFSYDKFIFLDLETTGLSGGVGVYPFLIGVGFFKEGDFHVYQLFMRDYHEEQAVLHSLAKIVSDNNIRGSVTYNGRAYDAHILQNRSITSGIDLSILDMPNYDLLPAVRRIFKKRIGDCSLSSVEREILKFYRVDDIPGFKVPEIYFDFVKRGFSEPMRKVFMHNLYDIISLAALAEHLCAVYSNPIENLIEPEDMFQMAKILMKTTNHAIALGILDHLTQTSGNLSFRANLATSFILKSIGDYEKASNIWFKCISSKPKASIIPYIELAKYFEHHVKDYEKALRYSRVALDITNNIRAVNIDTNDIKHRISRIEEKIRKIKKVPR